MRAESTYRPTIKSSAGAVGLMQIMPATGRQIAREVKYSGFNTGHLERPEVNVHFGCYYLAGRLKQFFAGDTQAQRLQTITRALASYNAGPHRVSGWGERADDMGLTPQAFVEEIPIKETREYVLRILKFYLVYLTAYPRDAETTGQEAAN